MEFGHVLLDLVVENLRTNIDSLSAAQVAFHIVENSATYAIVPLLPDYKMRLDIKCFWTSDAFYRIMQ